MADDDIVTVGTGEEALSFPEFVIHSDGKYYLTRALWEYDPHHPSMTPEQKAGVQQVADYHKRHHAGGGGTVVKADGGSLGAAQHTTPGH